MSNTNSPGVNSGAREGKTVPVSYKTPPCYFYIEDVLDTTMRKQAQIQ